METVIKLLKKKSRLLTFANFDDRPGKLFEMIEHLRASIFIASRGLSDSAIIYSTKYNRWHTENRKMLFNSLRYTHVTEFVNSYIIPKFSTELEVKINRRLLSSTAKISSSYSSIASKNNSVYYRAAGGGYFLLIKDEKSETYINGQLENVKAEKNITINDTYNHTAVGAILSSSLFYWNYIAYTDCRNLTKSFIDDFPIKKEMLTSKVLISCGKALFDDYEKNKHRKDTYYASTGRNVIYDEYYPRKSKSIIDEIDKAIATYYMFDEEATDFIINFDIKYRIGDELEVE